jgi:hypothetical protein
MRTAFYSRQGQSLVHTIARRQPLSEIAEALALGQSGGLVGNIVHDIRP